MVPVRVRHERDPYLHFLAITDGTGDFGGINKGQVRLRQTTGRTEHRKVRMPGLPGPCVKAARASEVLFCAAEDRLHPPWCRGPHHTAALRCALQAVLMAHNSCGCDRHGQSVLL